MLRSVVWWWAWALLAISTFTVGQNQKPVLISEVDMQNILDEYNSKASEFAHRLTEASWMVATDVGNTSKVNEKKEALVAYSEYEKRYWETYWKNAAISEYRNETLKRQLTLLKKLERAVLSSDDLKLLTTATTNMTAIYNTATVCPFTEQNCAENAKNRLTLDPEITERFAESRNFDELQYLWAKWHEHSGKLMRADYEVYVNLMNKMATGNNFSNAADYWKDEFEVDNFEEIIDNLWHTVKPLYDDLHTYMRYKLISIYGDKINRTDENIPAHLLGNMWGQSWVNLYLDTQPFANSTVHDVTATMKAQHYNALKMFEISDEFYMSLGLPSNNMSYTGKSIIVKPTDRNQKSAPKIQCHASAWDFSDGKDFRIKMCTSVNEEDLIVIHHEMGHIQYYIQYKHLPLQFRRGANPGFHEAIGDTIALSVANPRHLLKIGLLDEYKNTEADNINALYKEALQRIAFLPFGLLVDKWRWDVFSGKINTSEWNKHWWDLRLKYQKLSPPIARSENDFDPGAKYHVPGDSKYISYFVSHILEFSFYKALCIEAGEYGASKPNRPLHECDFYRSKEAGKKLADGLKLGGSKHWSEVLRIMTGNDAMSADAILEYFKPLHDFLKEANKKLAIEDEVRQLLIKYNENASKQCTKLQLADWDKSTDLKNETKLQIYQRAVSENAAFTKEQYKLHFSHYNADDFSDEKVRRQIKILKNLGREALDEPDLLSLTENIEKMVQIYNTATFCSYHKQNCSDEERFTLDPEITEAMAKSNNYDELEYLWTMWHNSTGPLMKPYYKKYIELSNKAATLNNFSDAGEMWRSKYEDPNFIENMKKIWKTVEPLYKELHEYTRNKLIKIYGDRIDRNDKNIPAHLLGNMWGQTWMNLYDRIKPYDNSSDLDVTASLQRNNYTALKIFEESDRFYQSLGLESNHMSYTGNSIIEKPLKKLIVCHASAWDFCDGKDFRIKQCTSVDHKNFITAHHEMGHIQYYILYKDQPLPFRTGANPGFHEAVGDTIALSTSNPTHLKKVGLLGAYKDTPEDNINALFKMALERIAFLPFGFLIDLYRYDLFSGKITEDNWNTHWEQLREEYQGVRSPAPRNDAQYFDAGAKFHVPSDYQYSAYFVAHILEFQFLRSLCTAAGQYEPNNPEKPLHKCDLEGSKVAGQRLRDGLSLGLSKHWSEALSVITDGERELSANAILEYFKPLHEFLIKENRKSRGDDGHTLPYVIGGFAILIIAVALISYGIYAFNRR